MSKALDDLHPLFRPLAFKLIARIVEAGVADLVIVSTGRTAEEQARYRSIGTSKRIRSLHQDGLAIDVAPARLIAMKNWAPDHPLWGRLGAIGERLGLVWGGRWMSIRDCPHFEAPAELVKRALASKPLPKIA